MKQNVFNKQRTPSKKEKQFYNRFFGEVKKKQFYFRCFLSPVRQFLSLPLHILDAGSEFPSLCSNLKGTFANKVMDIIGVLNRGYFSS